MLSDRLTDELVRFVTTLTTDYVATPGLDRLMSIVPDEIGVDGAGIMLADDEDELRFVSASDETVRLIERFQVETGEGPCVAASRTGEMVFIPDVAADERFPRFSGLAVDAGMAAVHSFPMGVEDTTIGAMNLYRAEPGPLDDGAVRTGTIITQMSAAYLMSARRADHATRMVEQIRQAKDRNAPIEQAKGFLVARLGVDPREGYERIRAYARAQRVRSLDVSQRLIDGHLDPEDLVTEG